MRTLFQNVLFLYLIFVLVTPAAGQITITSGDLAAYLAPGNSYVTKTDTASKTADIGSVGSTSWDFSGLVNNFATTSVTIRPDTTAYSGDFLKATNAIKLGNLYSYYKLGSDFEFLGAEEPVPYQIRIKNIPSNILYQLPLSSGTTWASTFAESTYATIGGTTYASVNHVAITDTVDAYGNLTLPGGAVYGALRLKIDTRTTTGAVTTRIITYQFLTKSGATVTVVPSDTNQPETGAISVSAVTWNGPITATSVAENPGSPVPSSFALEQNYPNPFNPSTAIRFELPQRSQVTLKIFNVLGQEVTTLINGIQAAGARQVQWNAADVPSGVYFYQIIARGLSKENNYQTVRKMVLLK